VWCSVLQCVAACCSVLQRAAVSFYWERCVTGVCSASVLRCLSTGSTTSLVSTTFLKVASVLQCGAVCCSVLQCLSTGSAASLVYATFLEAASVLQCVAACCGVFLLGALRHWCMLLFLR